MKTWISRGTIAHTHWGNLQWAKFNVYVIDRITETECQMRETLNLETSMTVSGYQCLVKFVIVAYQ